MAKVSLRVYSREIESMIEAGQLDEAIAHCQHILRTFPMHVETYRLLGKCFLEARRYTDAADIFQRALMAVPDDFVSHVGMSIIRDDEGKLDDAIWHMERAFEGQPSNPAIQGELRRLYGRRDGVEPSKIRLSRDALANMYAQGELFNQAIAEIRAVLAEDANRPDLQVMLARAYYRSNQKVEAAEMAANLLKKYAYCLDALRILVDVLPGSARSENTQVYRHRLGMLDPYSSFVSGSTFSTDQVPDAAVILERLEYKAGTAPVLPQVQWASSLGIKLTNEKHSDPIPDWTKTGESEGVTPVAAPDPSTHDAENQSIPDWMRNADWKEAGGKAQEEPVETATGNSTEPIAQADIPDWLKAMAPKEISDATVDSGSNPATLPFTDAEDTPDWLKDLVPQEKSETKVDPESVPLKNSFPEEKEKLAGLAKPGPAGEQANSAPVQPVVSPQDDRAFPEWLKEIGDTASAGIIAANTADALEQTESEGTTGSVTPVSPTAPTQVYDQVPASMPQAGDQPIPPATGETKPLEIEDDTMAWLESLSAKQGIKEEDLQNKADYNAGGMPDWLRSPDGQSAAPAVTVPPLAPGESLPFESTPPFDKEMSAQEPSPIEGPSSLTPPVEESAIPDKIEDETMAWLEGLAVGQGAKEENPLIEPEDQLEGMPDWLRSPDEQPVPLATPAATPVPGESMPLDAIASNGGDRSALEPPTAEELPPTTPLAKEPARPEKIQDETKVWLEGLATEEVTKREQSPTEPEDRLEGMPEWLRADDEQPSPGTTPDVTPAPGGNIPLETIPSLTGEGTVNEPVTPEELQPSISSEGNTARPVKIEDETMAWLEGLAARQGAKEEELLSKPEDRLEEIPDWLRSVDQQPSIPPVETPAPSETQLLEDHVSIAQESATLELAPAEEPSLPTPPVERSQHPLAEEVPVEGREDLALAQESGTGELPVIPQGDTETPPAWIQDSNQELPPSVEIPTPMTPEEDVSINSWLSKLDIQEALDKGQTSPTEDQPVAKPSADLPEWLKEMDKPAPPLETSKPIEDLPDWLREPAMPVDQGKVISTISEPVPEPEIPAWVDEEIPVSDQPAPTKPGEWVPVDDKPAPVPKVQPAAKPVSVPIKPPVQLWIPKGTGMLAHIPSQDKDAESLAAAQALLNADKLNEAMQAYAMLIKKNRLLDEVIHDLYEAIYRFPVDIIVWQTLGDAFMRSNRLQDALDAYTKAEELLR
jgi:tetratricopeptide (TPR) repeat protein